MLKKLRRKFIALIMVIATLVIAVSFGTICRIDYITSVNEVHGALAAKIAEAQMRPPATEEGNPADANADTQDAAAQNAAPNATDQGAADPAADPGALPAEAASPDKDKGKDHNEAKGGGPNIGGKRYEGESLIPVALYRSSDNASFEALGQLATASITDDVLQQATERIMGTLSANGTSETSGHLDNLGLYYHARQTGSETVIAFADESATSSWQALARILSIVGASALAVFFIVSIFFSRWALRPVERAWQQQQQFVADASHELKTPLTVILANTAILRSHPDTRVIEQSQWVESTQLEATHMQGLVNDMLELAKPAGEASIAVQRSNVDLTDLVEAGTLQFESVAFERGIIMESSIDRNVSIEGDPKRLQRLVSTLLDNACKYAEDGGHIEVTLRQSVRSIAFSVNNSGSTIAPEDLPHVFDRFYRADKARTTATGSFGLGLAIAREVAQDLGGEITCESSPAQGTTFTVTLPL